MNEFRATLSRKFRLTGYVTAARRQNSAIASWFSSEVFVEEIQRCVVKAMSPRPSRSTIEIARQEAQPINVAIRRLRRPSSLAPNAQTAGSYGDLEDSPDRVKQALRHFDLS